MVEPAPPGLPAPGRRGARPDLLPILTAQATIPQPILHEIPRCFRVYAGREPAPGTDGILRFIRGRGRARGPPAAAGSYGGCIRGPLGTMLPGRPEERTKSLLAAASEGRSLSALEKS